jgi:membrane protein required for colicin V production
MEAADYIVVIVVLVAVIFGVVRGFVREAIALLSWLVGIWVAWRFSGFLYPYLDPLEGAQKVWAARIIVLLTMLFLGYVVGALLGWLTRTAAGLGSMDRLLGCLFGLVRGAVLIGFVAMVGHALTLDQQRWWRQAKLAPYANSIGQWLEDFSSGPRPRHHHPGEAAGSEAGT